MIKVSQGQFAGGSLPLAGRSVALAPRPRIEARYDNSLTVDENRRQWWGADYLSAKSANSFQVRRQLRIRSRYEVSNNPYLYGICTSNADDLIGDGPTLEVKTKDKAYNLLVQDLWDEWCREVDLVEKLRTQKLAKSIDGEGFLVLRTLSDMEHPIKIYPVDMEADQVTTLGPGTMMDLWVDGLTLHPVTGRPTAFHVLKHHPGDFYYPPSLNPFQTEQISAKYVLHWFHKFRPGQVRGVPIFTPSLDMFADLRAYRKAVLSASQVAANFTAVGEQEYALADGDDTTPLEAFDEVPIDRGMLMMLPPGVKLSPFDPKQPTTTYEQFQEKVLGEAIRPLAYPLNLALGTSQKFNFSSAKLDHINYRQGLRVERRDCERINLIPLFRAWHYEGVLSGTIPLLKGLEPPRIGWHWPAFPSLDVMVDAQADQVKIAAGQTTWQAFWAERGQNWRRVLRQLAIEKKEMERLGLTFGDVVQRSISVSANEDKTADAEVANVA